MTDSEEELLDMLLQLCSHKKLAGQKFELDYDELLPELEKQGFDRSVVLSALDWISDLATELDSEESNGKSTRVFSAQECAVLNAGARNCLIKLENMGILNPVTRERVIDQIMALRNLGVENSLVKWVTYLVLCSHPEQSVQRDRMELFVADQFLGGIQ